MGREEMKFQDINKAKNPDLVASLAAMKRAAAAARQQAIQTGTAIIVLRNNKIVRLTAEDLKSELSEGWYAFLIFRSLDD